MNKIWFLILLINGSPYQYGMPYTWKEGCHSDAMMVYAEYMEKPNRPDILCVSEDGEKLYVSHGLDEMNRMGREREKNSPSPRPWAEVEADFDYEIRQCYDPGMQWFRAPQNPLREDFPT